MSLKFYNTIGEPLKNFYQWDADQTIKVSGLDVSHPPVFHFCNRKHEEAFVVIPTLVGSDYKAKIPNILLQEPEQLHIYIFEDENLRSVHTLAHIGVPVYPRPKPNDYVYRNNVEYHSVALIDARMKAIAGYIASGTTEDSNPELYDIRAKMNGTVYDTAGDAVRANELAVYELADQVDKVMNDLSGDISNLGQEVSNYANEIDEIRVIAESVSDDVKNFVDSKVPNGLYQDPDSDEVYLAVNGEPYGDPIIIHGGTGGGGGGSSNNAVLSLQNTCGTLSFSISKVDGHANFSFLWSSVEDGIPTGQGTLKIILNGANVTALPIEQGNVFLDLAQYCKVGFNNFRLEVSDAYGNKKTLAPTVQMLDYYLECEFDDTQVFTSSIKFVYTPYGPGAKDIHIEVDGVEVGRTTVTPSGRQQSFTIPKQSHGAHSVKCYFTAEVNGNTITSNIIYREFKCMAVGSQTPIIAIGIDSTTVDQYATIQIPYSVYDPVNLQAPVTFLVDDTPVSNLTVDRTTQTYGYRALTQGIHTITIQCRTMSKSLTITVKKVDVDIEAEQNDLSLYLTAVGRSNAEPNPSLWFYQDVAAQFTGYSWTNDGWQKNANGESVLRNRGEGRVTIPYRMFSKDYKVTGGTIEVEFETHDVRDYDAVFLSCMNGGRGIEFTAQQAILRTEQSSISVLYKDESHVRVSFTIEPRTAHNLIYVYVDGVMAGAVIYDSAEDFTQPVPAPITIGSAKCGVDIYNIRVYDSCLTHQQIVSNWIADTQNGADLVTRFTRNNVYDEYDNIVIDKLPNDLCYAIITGPSLPQSKGDKKTVDIAFYDPTNPNRNWTSENVTIDVQGTSSQYYARKNYKIKCKKFNTSSGVVDKISWFANAVPANVFCWKADVASSEGTNNVELVKLFNDINPAKTPPQLVDPRVRQGIDGFPMVVFWNDGDNTTFLGKYNGNDDKSSEQVFGFQEGDQSWEVKNNVTDRVIFKKDDLMTMIQGEGGAYPAWMDDFEARYPDGATDIDLLQEFVSWVKSTDRKPDKFKKELSQWCNVQDSIFYYVFTLTFLMVDSWAKNAFPTRFASDGKWYWLPYDFDTALGINNEGQLTFGYSLEDIDVIGADTLVFNGQNSVFWTNLRTAYADEIQSMYASLRSGGTFSYPVVRDRFLNHQSKWSEAIKNADAVFKYIEPYTGDQHDASYLPMLLGDKKSQRDWWLYNRFRYLDSKFKCGDNMADGNVINIRAYASGDMTFTAYADIYMTVVMGAASKPMSFRATRNVPVHIPCTLDNVNDLEMAFGSAQSLTSIGDLAPLKIGYANFAAGTKLESIKVGDADPNYRNENLQSISFGNNTLLKKIDCRNCVNLGKGTQGSIDLSSCTGIEEVYMDNTSIASVVLPNGGQLRRLHLPSTITNLTILNQKAMVEFVIPSYSNISTMRLENVADIINPIELLDYIQPHARVRIIGFDVKMASSDAVVALCNKLDAFRGLDENGNNLDTAQIQGTLRVPEMSQTRLAELKTRYPYMDIIADKVICYVTYMDDQGVSVIDTEIVPFAGNCQKKFDTSLFTKNPTEDSTYVFNGWATTPGGRPNVNSLLNIVQDTTLYQAFRRIDRQYTVELYDGVTLVSQQEVSWGKSATMPTINRATFDMWTPNPRKVYGAFNYYTCDSNATGSGEISDDWSTIVSKIKSGNHPYKVGQTKQFDINGVIYTAQLVGLKRDLKDANGNFNNTSWLLKEIYDKRYPMSVPIVEVYEKDPKGPGWTYSEDQGCWISMNQGLKDTEGSCTWNVSSITDGTLSIDYKVGSESPYDHLSIWVDGELICDRLSGHTDWKQFTKNFMAGETMTIKAVYAKDESGDEEPDGGFICIYAGSQGYIEPHPDTILAKGRFLYANEGTGSVGGWEHSELRKICNGEIYNALPEVIRNAITPALKYHQIYDTEKMLRYRQCSDKIWVPTRRDMYAVDNEKALYHEVFPNEDSLIKRLRTSGGALEYWVMDAYDTKAGYNYGVVGNNGVHIHSRAESTTTGLVFGFCI